MDSVGSLFLRPNRIDIRQTVMDRNRNAICVYAGLHQSDNGQRETVGVVCVCVRIDRSTPSFRCWCGVIC